MTNHNGKLKPKFRTYPQFNRIFTLNKMAVERCKADFPDCFHFKKLLATECEELADRLKMGLALLNELKLNGVTLSSEQNTQFKAFRNGVKYFIKQLEDTAQHVADVDTGNFTATAYPFAKTATADGTEGAGTNENTDGTGAHND